MTSASLEFYPWYRVGRYETRYYQAPRKKWRRQEQQWHTTWGNGPAFPRRLRACRATSTSAFCRPRPPSEESRPPEDVIINRPEEGNLRLSGTYTWCNPLLFVQPKNSSRTRIPIYLAAPEEEERVLRAMQDAISCSERYDTRTSTHERVRNKTRSSAR